MIDDFLLRKDVQDFINANLSEDFSKLALKKNPFPDVPFAILLNQIQAKKKAKEKLPHWFSTKNILFPLKLSIEQTSSETTAHFKASLISGTNLIDLTGGFGIDAFYFSEKFNEVVYCENQEDLASIVTHNFKIFRKKNIQCYCGDSEIILKSLQKKFDWLYVDPSRRDYVKGKVFQLKDCVPNVVALTDFYFSFTSNIMIKTSPLLDITAVVNDVNYIEKVYIVSVKNEIKELLWILKKDYKGKLTIHSVSINDSNVTLIESIHKEYYPVKYSEPLTYLYEPNASLMKSGTVNCLGLKYDVFKLQEHSHLFTNVLLIDFPGRRFKILEILDFSKQSMKKFHGQSYLCTVRNFPLSVETLRNKYKIKDGGTTHLFFTTTKEFKKIVIVCQKIASCET